MNVSENAEKIIKDWMQEVVSKGTWKNPHDLHIDVIDPDLKKNPSSWIETAIELFKIALELRDQLGLPFVVMLSFHLSSSKKRESIPNYSALKIEDLSLTPPSIYLYERNSDLWEKIFSNLSQYEIDSFYRNWKIYSTISNEVDEDNMYDRNLYIVG